MPSTPTEKRPPSLLRLACSRHSRRKHGLILCEGIRACSEALRHRPQWLRLVALSDDIDQGVASVQCLTEAGHDLAEVVVLPSSVFAQYTDMDTPQGVAMVLQRPNTTELPDLPDPFTLVLDRVQDPGNAGTILRTAWAVGLRNVVVTNGTVDPFSPKAIRSGMGAQFALEICMGGNLADVRQHLIRAGIMKMWEAVPENGINCYDDQFDLANSALVVGNEANGSALLPDSQRVTIPMPGRAESLNAAQAATILMFEGVRRGLLK